MNQVVLTGMGLVTGLGNDVDTVFRAVLEGKTAVRTMEDWRKYNGLFSHVAAPAEPFDEKILPRSVRRTMSRMSEMASVASLAALRDADLTAPALNAERTAMIYGSTTGSPVVLEAFFNRLAERGGPEGQLGTTFFKVMNHSVASNVAMALGFGGPSLGTASACTTSSQAIALGWELLQSGLYDVVLAGGTDELHYTTAAVFDIVGAASRGYNDRPERTPRPFDRDRDGLAVAEGAAVVVMETQAHAKARGVRVHGRLAGAAYRCDGVHMSHPQTGAMAETMRMALGRAGVEPSAIGYVNAHATATPVGDVEEAKATAEVFGERARVSSLKGHFGHSLAACGALEVAMCVEMLRRQVLLPTRNLENPDPECAVVDLLRENHPASFSAAISNNFAFGGMSTSLVILSP